MVAVSERDAASAGDAAAGMEHFVELSARGWTHPACEPSSLRRAAQTLARLGAGGEVNLALGDVLALDSAMITIRATNPNGLPGTLALLETLAGRARISLGLAPRSRVSRHSPNHDWRICASSRGWHTSARGRT